MRRRWRADLSEEFGVETVGTACDVTRRGQVEDAVSAAMELFGRIDILINNAGTNRPARVVDMSDETWDLVLDTSLKGTFHTCRAILPIMTGQHFGRIVNMASVAGFMGLKAGHAHYAAAKAGVMAFTRCLAMEAAEHLVTVNTIAPSFIHNEFIPRIYPEEEIRRMQDEHPLPEKGHTGRRGPHCPVPRYRWRIHHGPNHLRHRWKLDALKKRNGAPPLPPPALTRPVRHLYCRKQTITHGPADGASFSAGGEGAGSDRRQVRA